MNRNLRKLSLRRDTIRALDVSNVRGGAGPNASRLTCPSGCTPTTCEPSRQLTKCCTAPTA